MPKEDERDNYPRERSFEIPARDGAKTSLRNETATNFNDVFKNIKLISTPTNQANQ
jgi:hypothetical protein